MTEETKDKIGMWIVGVIEFALVVAAGIYFTSEWVDHITWPV